MSRKVDLDLLAKNIILTLVSYTFKKSDKGRPTVCSNEKYLEYMFLVLKEGIGWEYIQSDLIKGDTVRRKFKEWTNKNIFKKAWTIIIHIYATLKLDFEDLFIDASHIKNIFGVEEVGVNHYDRFRLSTKLSIITDDNGVPVGIDIKKGNTHDINMLEDTLNSIPIDIYSTEYLIGDKGYCIGDEQSKELYKKYLLDLITPRKRNSRRIFSDEYNQVRRKKLKGRFVVEQTFGWLKKYKRIRNRCDKKINIFSSFIYFGRTTCSLTHRVHYL